MCKSSDWFGIQLVDLQVCLARTFLLAQCRKLSISTASRCSRWRTLEIWNKLSCEIHKWQASNNDSFKFLQTTVRLRTWTCPSSLMPRASTHTWCWDFLRTSKLRAQHIPSQHFFKYDSGIYSLHEISYVRGWEPKSELLCSVHGSCHTCCSRTIDFAEDNYMR